MRRIKLINGILHDAHTGLQIWCWSRSTVCQDTCAAYRLCERGESSDREGVGCKTGGIFGGFMIGELEQEEAGR